MFSLLKRRFALSILLLEPAAMAQQPKVLAPHDKIWPKVPANLVKLPAGTQRSMVGGYWRIDADRKATIYLRNGLEIAPLTVTPILYLSNGARYPLDPVTLAESGTATLSINEALAKKGISPWATLSGYVEVDYSWAWDPICVTVTSVDPVHSVVFSDALQPSAMPQRIQQGMANEMRGMWWKPEAGITGFVALSNTTGQPIAAQVALTGSDDANLAFYAVTVSPHGTKTINLAALESQPVGTAGGLHVTAQGSLSGLALHGGIEDKSAGYSATLPFHYDAVDNAASKTEIYAEPGLMTGAADPMMLFPADTAFRPFSVAQNVSDAPVVVTPSIYWMKGGTARSARLPSTTLAPGETANLDAASSLASAGLSAFNGTFTMTVESQGKRHALLLASGSVDLKNTYVFQVVPRMVKKSLSKSLSYWSTANGDDTMVTVWNPADEAQDYRVTVNFDGGHYRLPIHLDARATRNFNLSELIQSQIPDDEGNVIPLGVHEGSAKISGIHADNESILVAVDGGVYNARKATCWYYCIECSGAELASLIAEPLVVKKGGQATLSLVTTDNNGNTSYAPAASWSSSNTYVASISGQAEDSTLTVTGNAAGSANFYASSSEVPIYSSNYCAYNAECPDEGYVNGSGGGTVAPLSITSVSGFVYGSTGPFVITGTGFSTFNTSGQPPSIGLSGGGVTFSGVAVTSTTITGTYTSTCGAVVGQQTITVNFPNADVQGGIPVTGTASVSLPAAPTPFIKFNGNSISGTQSVVVGQQIALSASVSLPNCMNLSLQQWSLPSSSGTPIGNYQASTTSGAVTGIGSVIASSSNYTFYWTTAGNSLTEQYEYTMAPSSGGGEVYSPAATATFNVSAPTWTGNSISATPSTLSISPLGGSVGPVLSFGYFTGTPPNLSGTPGITFSTSAHQPSGSNGTFSWAQIILGDTLTYTTSGGGQSPCNMGSGLDNLFPYPSQSATSTSDSPYMTLPSSYAIAQRSFSAQMYLLWNSNTTNSIYVSVGSVKWSFSGTATQTAGTWAVTSGNPPPAPTYQPYNGEPTWSSHTQNGVCQGNTN